MRDEHIRQYISVAILAVIVGTCFFYYGSWMLAFVAFIGLGGEL